MAGGGFMPESEFKGTGWQRVFNTYTKRGRLNTSLAVFGVTGALLIMRKWRNKGKKAVKEN